MISRVLASLVLLLLLVGRVEAGLGQTTGAAVITVPFDFTHGVVVVQAKLSGEGPFSMLLDTGADPCVIDLAIARKIGLKMDAKGGRGAGTGTDVNPVYGTVLPAVELAKLRATNVEAVAMDLSNVSRKIGRPIAGVLDYPLLKNRIVQFDFPGRVVRFLSSAGDPMATNGAQRGTTLSFRYQDDILADGVVVNGRKMTANVDTGCNSAFQLTPAGVIAAGLDNAPTTTSESVGFNGAAQNRQGRIGKVNIGGIAVLDPTATFFNKGTGYDDEAWGVRIGNEFMQHYIVTFDFRAMTICFERP